MSLSATLGWPRHQTTLKREQCLLRHPRRWPRGKEVARGLQRKGSVAASNLRCSDALGVVPDSEPQTRQHMPQKRKMLKRSVPLTRYQSGAYPEQSEDGLKSGIIDTSEESNGYDEDIDDAEPGIEEVGDAHDVPEIRQAIALHAENHLHEENDSKKKIADREGSEENWIWLKRHGLLFRKSSHKIGTQAGRAARCRYGNRRRHTDRQNATVSRSCQPPQTRAVDWREASLFCLL